MASIVLPIVFVVPLVLFCVYSMFFVGNLASIGPDEPVPPNFSVWALRSLTCCCSPFLVCVIWIAGMILTERFRSSMNRKYVGEKTLVISYPLEPRRFEAHADFTTCLSRLAASDLVIVMQSASGFSQTGEASVTIGPPEYLACNVNVCCLMLHAQRYYFFPDCIVVFDGADYRKIPWTSAKVAVNAAEGSFTAIEYAIGWAHANADGSPDARYRFNYQVKRAIRVQRPFREVCTFVFDFVEPAVVLVTRDSQAAAEFAAAVADWLGPGAISSPRPIPRPVRPLSYYEILGVSRDATPEEIKAKYRELVMKYHPDRNPGDEKAAEIFKGIGEAYSVLSDPDKRRAYDRG